MTERRTLSLKFHSIAQEPAVVQLSRLAQDAGILRVPNDSRPESIAEFHQSTGTNDKSAGDGAVRSVNRHGTLPIHSGMPPPAVSGAYYFSLASREKVHLLGRTMHNAITTSNAYEHENEGGATITRCVHISATLGKEDAVITMIVGFEAAWKLLDALEYGEVDNL